MVKKVVSVLVCILIFTSMTAFAVDTYSGYNVPVDIEVHGNFIKCSNKPILIDDSTYIPLRAFSDAIGGKIEWNDKEMSAVLNASGHIFAFYPDMDFCLVDGEKKDYYSVFYNDLTYIPVRVVSEVLGYNVSWDDFYLTVKIDAPNIDISEEYIDKSYTYEDILYLGKITHIESGYQHFNVKLGVAGTIINRVKSPLFPSSIKDVIFDTKYSIQFPPAHTDKINVTPSKESIIAAKCVLNGANVVGDSLYFVDTVYAPSSWVHNNRPHFITIYDMSFYE